MLELTEERIEELCQMLVDENELDKVHKVLALLQELNNLLEEGKAKRENVASAARNVYGG